MTGETVISRLAQIREYNPSGNAVVADGSCLGYSKLWRYAKGLASFLLNNGSGRGSHIVIKAYPDVNFVISVIGCFLAGAVAIPIEKKMGKGAVCDVIEKVDASYYIGDGGISGIGFLDISSVISIAEKYSDEKEACVLPGENDLAVILFTTGTTGDSKGVMLSHKALFSACDNSASADRLDKDSKYLIASPLNHASGFRKLLSCLISGASAVFLDGFIDVAKFYRTIKDEKINVLLLPPPALRILLKVSASELAKYFTQIKTVHSGACALPEADKERLSEILPETRLLFGYGSSEAGNSTVYDFAEYPGLENCVGKSNIHTDVFVVDDDGKIITESCKTGCLAISGDTLMSGYYKDEKRTSEVMKGGVLYTNDIGYIDEAGFVFVLGRKGDVINSGGLKISPSEIENTVLRYKGISECACFGVPDRINGEVPKLCIVCDGDDFDMNDFRKYLMEKFEFYKVPKEIEKVSQLPKTSNGKLDRKKLK